MYGVERCGVTLCGVVWCGAILKGITRVMSFEVFFAFIWICFDSIFTRRPRCWACFTYNEFILYIVVQCKVRKKIH